MRHQTVTDGQQGVNATRIGEGHVVLKDTDQHAADEVDEQNQQASNCVTAYKLAGTVHGTVELGLLGHFGTTALGFRLVDEAGVEVGVDGHLLAGHRVEGEARAHLGNTPGTLGDDHKVDDHQDCEHHDTDDVVTADHHFTEGLNHLARSSMTVLTVKHDHPRRRDVQRQTQQGGDQQDGREHREIQRPQGVDAHQQHDDGQRNVEREKYVQQERRHGQHHHCQHDQQQQRNAQLTTAQACDVAACATE